MKFNNYLLNLAYYDLKRYTNKERHMLKIKNINNILLDCYNEIKLKLRRRDFLRYILNELKLPRSTLECWINGRNAIPIYKAYKFLNLWKKVCNKDKKEFEKKWNLIFKRGSIRSQGRNENIVLPKTLNEDLAYISGLISADGYIKSDIRLLNTKRNAEHSICIYSDSKILLNKIKILFYDNFNVPCKIYFSRDKKGSWFTLRCAYKPVHRFFCDILGMKRGSKTGKVHIPKLIRNGNLSIKKNFISGFFDGDGGVGISVKNPWLEIAQKSNIKNVPPEVLLWIKSILFDLNIKMSEVKKMSRRPYIWRLRTSSKKEIKKFYKLISTRHPRKEVIFKNIINFSY